MPKSTPIYNIYDSDYSMPVPEIPRFDVMRYLIGEAFSIAIVAFTVTVSIIFRSSDQQYHFQVSMGKLFAKKHSYRIDPNQVRKIIFIYGVTSEDHHD